MTAKERAALKKDWVRLTSEIEFWTTKIHVVLGVQQTQYSSSMYTLGFMNGLLKGIDRLVVGDAEEFLVARLESTLRMLAKDIEFYEEITGGRYAPNKV